MNCSNHRIPKVCFPSVQKLVGEKEEPIAPLTKEVANLNKQLEKMTKAQEKEAATLKVSCRYETDKNLPQSFDNILIIICRSKSFCRRLRYMLFTKESVGKAKVHSQQIESLERDLEGHQEKAFDISRLIIDT